MKHWMIGIQMQLSILQIILFHLTYDICLDSVHTSNSTHHPSRSRRFSSFFHPSSSHTSWYTLYSHLFHPNIFPLSYLLDNRIKTYAAVLLLHSYLTIGFLPWSASTTLLRMIIVFYISIYRHVLFLLKLFHQIPSRHIKGCMYIRICLYRIGYDTASSISPWYRWYKVSANCFRCRERRNTYVISAANAYRYVRVFIVNTIM